MQSFFLQRNYFRLHKNQRNYLCSHFWKSFLNLTAYYAVKLLCIGSLRSPRGFAPFLLTTPEYAVILSHLPTFPTLFYNLFYKTPSRKNTLKNRWERWEGGKPYIVFILFFNFWLNHVIFLYHFLVVLLFLYLMS